MDLTDYNAYLNAMRRRKKRGNGAPGSSLTGLNRNSVRVVELVRSSMGYGFTISGQKPCLLRGIVEGSPAEKAGLAPGNCLVGVNGEDVSHLAHDDVVRMIGLCSESLRLHVAVSYFSESSEDESYESTPRPRYPYRPRNMTKGAVSKKDEICTPEENQNHVLSPATGLQCFQASTDPSNTRWAKPYPVEPLPEDPQEPAAQIRQKNISSTPKTETFNTAGKSPIEIVSVFAHLEGISEMSRSVDSIGSNEKYNTNSSSGSSRNYSARNPVPEESFNPRGFFYQAVVYYMGTIELPVIEEKNRPNALSACIQTVILEKRAKNTVLLRVHYNGISLFKSSLRYLTTVPFAFYSSDIISYCGADKDDRRYFGVVTFPNVNIPANTCHVFMVDPWLVSHSDHRLLSAEKFGFRCTRFSRRRNGHVLGLQECNEFPATPDPILASILNLNASQNSQTASLRSPSEASLRLESTNSSNSDSGIGFKDDSDPNSARIYDIIDNGISEEYSESLILDQKSYSNFFNPRDLLYEAPEPLTFVNAESSMCLRDGVLGTSNAINRMLPRRVNLCHNDRKLSLESGKIVSTETSEGSDMFGVANKMKSRKGHGTVAMPNSSVKRNVARSLDDLCSLGSSLKSANIINTPGISTSALDKDDDIDAVKFKVPEPKTKTSGVKKWTDGIDNLLNDRLGFQEFKFFLEQEFSVENLNFYDECRRYKKLYNDRTESQRILEATTIAQRYIGSSASDPVNIDFTAQAKVMSELSNPSSCIFDSAMSQIYDLLKFDCYPRFLKSDVFNKSSRPALTEITSMSDSEASVKSQNVHRDRRSSLKWTWKRHNRKKDKAADRLNSDISMIQRQVNSEASDTEETKYFRISFPDNSTTVFQCIPGMSLETAVLRQLEKHELDYDSFDVISVKTGKSIDLNTPLSDLDEKEIKIEKKAFVDAQLPNGWKLGIRAYPWRKLSEVLKPTLANHQISIDTLIVIDDNLNCEIDVKTPIEKISSHKLRLYYKDVDVQGIIKARTEQGNVSDDQLSGKTSSSRSSNGFKGLFRSSKKIKKKVNEATSLEHSSLAPGLRGPMSSFETQVQVEPTGLTQHANVMNDDSAGGSSRDMMENFGNAAVSPLSSIPNLRTESRNRQPVILPSPQDQRFRH